MIIMDARDVPADLAEFFEPVDMTARRDVLQVNTQPFPGSHFAVFPEKLIEPCILAGCPERACAACGAPWERVATSKPWVGPDGHCGCGKKHSSAKIDTAQQRHEIRDERYCSQSITTGFAPSCHCAAATVPGIVLDPFGGSGTVGVVAKKFGRRAILIEQSLEYCHMAAERLAATPTPLPFVAGEVPAVAEQTLFDLREEIPA